MFNPQTELLITILSGVLPESGATPTKTWSDAREAIAACGEVEDDVAAAVNKEDSAALRAILDQWFTQKRYLAIHDREILKQAMKAYRKRFKVTVLDAESSVGGGPMSSGRKSSIVGIKAPDRFPRSVWDELVRQKRLLAGRDGTYEFAPGEISS